MLADDDDKRAIGRERTRLSKSSFGMYIIVVVFFLTVSFSRVSPVFPRWRMIGKANNFNTNPRTITSGGLSQ